MIHLPYSKEVKLFKVVALSNIISSGGKIVKSMLQLAAILGEKVMSLTPQNNCILKLSKLAHKSHLAGLVFSNS